MFRRYKFRNDPSSNATRLALDRRISTKPAITRYDKKKIETCILQVENNSTATK
jgi:hypothetical protein